MRTVSRASFAALAALLITVVLPARATPIYSAIFVYGDSLSDNGNLYKLTGGLAPASPPYYNGRYSNGPVAVEQLAAQLKTPLIDAAVAGATTGVGNIGDGGTQTSPGAVHLPGMLAEVQASAPPAALAPSSLFIVWGGADDFISGGDPTTAVADVDSIVKTLELDGANPANILVPNLPNLSLTPEFYGNALAAAYTSSFNTALQNTLPAGVTLFDTNAFLSNLIANAGANGIMNTTTPCYNQVTGTVCSNPSQYLFWDSIHPTTTADTLLANAFAADLSPAVAAAPEPSSLLLLGTGLAGLAGLLRKRKGTVDVAPPRPLF